MSDLVLRLIATITEMDYKLIDAPEILPCVLLHAKNYNVAAIKCMIQLNYSNYNMDSH